MPAEFGPLAGLSGAAPKKKPIPGTVGNSPLPPRPSPGAGGGRAPATSDAGGGYQPGSQMPGYRPPPPGAQPLPGPIPPGWGMSPSGLPNGPGGQVPGQGGAAPTLRPPMSPRSPYYEQETDRYLAESTRIQEEQARMREMDRQAQIARQQALEQREYDNKKSSEDEFRRADEAFQARNFEDRQTKDKRAFETQQGQTERNWSLEDQAREDARQRALWEREDALYGRGRADELADRDRIFGMFGGSGGGLGGGSFSGGYGGGINTPGGGGGSGSVQGGPGGSGNPVADMAFARAKDREGVLAAAGLRNLRSEMTNSGLAGSGSERRALGNLVGGATGRLNDVSTEQALAESRRAWDVEDRNFNAATSMRQTLAPALLGLLGRGRGRAY